MIDVDRTNPETRIMSSLLIARKHLLGRCVKCSSHIRDDSLWIENLATDANLESVVLYAVMFATYPLILCDSMSARNNASASGPSAADVFSRNRSPALLQLSSHGCTHEGVYHTARVDGTSDARGVCGGCEERARGDDARAVCENGTTSDPECASEEMDSPPSEIEHRGFTHDERGDVSEPAK